MRPKEQERESTVEANMSDAIVAEQQKSEVTVLRTEEGFTETASIQKKEGRPSSNHILLPFVELRVFSEPSPLISETYSLLVKVAETLAQSLVAKIFIEAYDETLRQLRQQGATTEESSDGDSLVFESTNEALAPSFEIMRETYNISEGQNVTVHTSIRGQPCHTVEWYHNGERLQESR